MKIAILETHHFQYGFTQSEIFSDAEKIFFVTPKIYTEMHDYNSKLCIGKFIQIKNLQDDYKKVIQTCQDEKIDLLLLSPVFDSFEAVLAISSQIKCKKVITIHNLNFWFNSKYWSLNSLKERIIKRKIIDCYDYIAVEDFIYKYISNTKKRIYKKHQFIYIPFTIFHPNVERKFSRDSQTFKVVLPGFIHRDRRRYEDVIEVIERFAHLNSDITFSFAGKPVEKYGEEVIHKLKNINKIKPGMVTFFDVEEEIKADRFLMEMETADFALSTSTTKFKALGTTEYIGKTKPTAAIHDMMTFELPGLLPNHLKVPENLEGSVFNYSDKEDLFNKLNHFLINPDSLTQVKNQAKINSLNFTAEKIKNKLPKELFFENQF